MHVKEPDSTETRDDVTASEDAVAISMDVRVSDAEDPFTWKRRALFCFRLADTLTRKDFSSAVGPFTSIRILDAAADVIESVLEEDDAVSIIDAVFTFTPLIECVRVKCVMVIAITDSLSVIPFCVRMDVPLEYASESVEVTVTGTPPLSH